MNFDKTHNLLLTGVTGFIGSNLAVHLLLNTQARLFCLVRPSAHDQSALVRAVKAAALAAALEAPIQDCLDRLIPISGDLTQPHLGISPGNLTRLHKAGIREIWHCAASLKFEAAHQPEIFEKNVVGVQRVLDLARALHISQFNHVSTAYVAGKQQGLIPETAYGQQWETNNWYEASKRQAEDRVLRAAQVGWFRVKIFRPSIVIGNSTTFDSTSTSGFYGFIGAIAQFKHKLDLNQPGYLAKQPLRVLVAKGVERGLNLIPVDILVKQALDLAQDSHQSKIFYHLTNPFPVKLETIRRALAGVYPDFPIEGVTDKSQLQAIERLFHRRLRFYQPYLQDDKQFERSWASNFQSDQLSLSVLQLERYVEQFIHRLHWQEEQSA